MCPNCGENKSLRLTKKGTKGIYKDRYVWTGGVFKVRYMRVDRYSCYTCGSRWESEPYEYM